LAHSIKELSLAEEVLEEVPLTILQETEYNPDADLKSLGKPAIFVVGRNDFCNTIK
jgi:hypothetical protein